jgi:hypothetical protein
MRKMQARSPPKLVNIAAGLSLTTALSDGRVGHSTFNHSSRTSRHGAHRELSERAADAA